MNIELTVIVTTKLVAYNSWVLIFKLDPAYASHHALYVKTFTLYVYLNKF